MFGSGQQCISLKSALCVETVIMGEADIFVQLLFNLLKMKLFQAQTVFNYVNFQALIFFFISGFAA